MESVMQNRNRIKIRDMERFQKRRSNATRNEPEKIQIFNDGAHALLTLLSNQLTEDEYDFLTELLNSDERRTQ